MRRETCSSSASLKAGGAERSELSRKSVTSAVLRAGRVPEPEKMTSSIPEARMFLYELSPMTQRNASTRLDLPQPLGPTTPVSPRSITNSLGSTKDLKPTKRSLLNFMRACPGAHHAPRRKNSCGAYRRGSITADICSIDIAPEYFFPFMKKVGVAVTPKSEPLARTALTSSRSFWSVKQASKDSCEKPASFAIFNRAERASSTPAQLFCCLNSTSIIG